MYSRGLKNLARRAKDYFMDKTSRHITVERMKGDAAETFKGMMPSDIGLQNAPGLKRKKY